MIPGTTRQLIPAASQASISSSKRPNTVGSPAFRRTTCKPFNACSTISASMSDCCIAGPKPSLPALMIVASRRASSRISGVTRRSWITTSALSKALRAFKVSSSGSPGPAPTRSTWPAFWVVMMYFSNNVSRVGITADTPSTSTAFGPASK